MIVLGFLGAKALFLLYGWLLSAIIASYLAERKGYSEKSGLASGLLLYVIGPIIWLVMPAKTGSKWKRLGPFGRGEGRRPTPPDA
jgi:fucose permease